MNGYLGDDRAAGSWLKRFFIVLTFLAALGLVVALPIAGAWLYLSGDVGVGRAVAAQKQEFALYGSGLSTRGTDDLPYKLTLYEARQPVVVLAGSAGMAAARQSIFTKPMINMCGTADSISTLRQGLDEMLARHKPDVILLALDFWWFSTAWETDPFDRSHLSLTPRGSTLEALRMPIRNLMEGRISLSQFLFLDFSNNRYGIRAQFHQSGWGPDGSWYAGDALTLRSEDTGFKRTLDRVRRQTGEFAPQSRVSAAHLDAFADIYFRLRGRGVTPLVFLAPLPGPVLDALQERAAEYPHLYNLLHELEIRGIPLMNSYDPRYIDGNACEFLDGLHAGEVTAARILRELCSAWNGLLGYIDMERVHRVITEWKGHAAVTSDVTRNILETDFLGLGCVKRTP